MKVVGLKPKSALDSGGTEWNTEELIEQHRHLCVLVCDILSHMYHHILNYICSICLFIYSLCFQERKKSCPGITWQAGIERAWCNVKFLPEENLQVPRWYCQKEEAHDEWRRVCFSWYYARERVCLPKLLKFLSFLNVKDQNITNEYKSITTAQNTAYLKVKVRFTSCGITINLLLQKPLVVKKNSYGTIWVKTVWVFF